MAQLIIYKNGAYNIYETTSDGPMYTSALTEVQLYEVIRQRYGQRGVEELPKRLARAHATGCSSALGESLEDILDLNRAGAKETKMPIADFIAKYLTLGN